MNVDYDAISARIACILAALAAVDEALAYPNDVILAHTACWMAALALAGRPDDWAAV